MSEYIVDESKFFLNDEEDFSCFEEGFILPDGIEISEKLDQSDTWQLFISKDSSQLILAAESELADRWLAGGYVDAKDLQRVVNNGVEYVLLFSPANLKLQRLTQVRCGHSARAASSLFCAFRRSRMLDPDINLRDGIFFELKSVILPTFSLVPKVSDKALMVNALRDKNEVEDLTVSGGGLSWFVFCQLLKERGIYVNNAQPYFESGESTGDFIKGIDNALITGPLILKDHYQLFDTTAGFYVLMMDKLWSDALIAAGLLGKIALSYLPVGNQRFCALALSKRAAVENLDDRTFALDLKTAVLMAQAIRRTRNLLKEANLDNALYVQELGLLLPESFSCDKTSVNDSALMQKILVAGPYAGAPFMDDVSFDIQHLASLN